MPSIYKMSTAGGVKSLNHYINALSGNAKYIDPTAIYQETVAWYQADDLTAANVGTTWQNRAGNPITNAMTCNTAGSVVTSLNGHKAITGASFRADITNDSKISQGGAFTYLTVLQTNQSGFGPYFGIGEWWGNYSSAYGGYYYHGLYASQWGYFSATPAVQGMRKANGSTFLDTISNNNYAGADPNNAIPQTPSYIETNSSENADRISEILVWSRALSNTEVATVTSYLRTKYAF